MKVIESIRNNRTYEVHDVDLWFENDNSGDPAATAIALVAQAVAGRNEVTLRDLFTTTAIRIEF